MDTELEIDDPHSSYFYKVGCFLLTFGIWPDKNIDISFYYIAPLRRA